MCCRNKENVKPDDRDRPVASCEVEPLYTWMGTIPNQIADSLRRVKSWKTVLEVTLDQRVAATLLSDEFCEIAFIRNAHWDNCQSGNLGYYHNYQRAADALASLGFSFSDVVRTWIYLCDIDHTYEAFNAQRDRFYREQGGFDRLIPASTGAGIPQPGAAMVLHVLAVKPRGPKVTIQAVSSPLQCEATAYKKSFSRAVEIGTPAYRWLLISGTASIAPQGNSIFMDDYSRQAGHTVKVIDALLASRDITLRNLFRIIGYTKHQKDMAVTGAFLKDWPGGHLQALNIQADICRKELLFEVEAEALIENP